MINTPLGRSSHVDDALIRQAALKYDIPCITTLSGARAAVAGIAAVRRSELQVTALQQRHAAARRPPAPTEPDEVVSIPERAG